MDYDRLLTQYTAEYDILMDMTMIVKITDSNINR